MMKMILQFAAWIKKHVLSFFTLTSLGGIILVGIVTNKLYDILNLFLSRINLFTPWTLVAILSIICIIFVMGGIRIVPFNPLSDTIRARIIKIDDSLLRLFACWGQPPSKAKHNEQYRNVLIDILTEIIPLFGRNDDGRAAILLRDPTDSSFITCDNQVSVFMPPESIRAMRFYVGNEAQRQREEGGTAGQAFVNGEILVGHMDKSNGHRRCKDLDRYIEFPDPRPYNPYKSFVCVPIHGFTPGCNTLTRLGVLCIDSQREDAFDGKNVKPTLELIAIRIAVAILTCENLP